MNQVNSNIPQTPDRDRQLDRARSLDRARLLRWGFSWFMFGFLLLLTDVFHLSGPLWQLIILLLAYFISPDINIKGHWIKKILIAIGALTLFFALAYFAVWLQGKIGLSPGIFLAMLSFVAGFVFQILGGVFQSKISEPSSGLANPLIEKIRRL